MIIETKTSQHYTLRKYQDSDLNDLFILMNNQEVNLYLSWFVHNTVLDTKRYIEEVKSNQDCFYVIEDNKKQRVIGFVTLSHIDEWHSHGELEYALLSGYWGKGIIADIFEEFVREIKQQHFENIYAKNNVENKRSERVLEKIGMIYSYQSHELFKPKNIPVAFQYYQLDIKNYSF
ncbi:MAG: GNAT family N-acetyltransferase [Coprobacillus sp.]